MMPLFNPFEDFHSFQEYFEVSILEFLVKFTLLSVHSLLFLLFLRHHPHLLSIKRVALLEGVRSELWQLPLRKRDQVAGPLLYDDFLVFFVFLFAFPARLERIIVFLLCGDRGPLSFSQRLSFLQGLLQQTGNLPSPVLLFHANFLFNLV